MVEGSVEGEKLLALPGRSEWPFIKGGLFLKTAAEGWKRSQDAQFPKESEQGLLCLFQALPKMQLRI